MNLIDKSALVAEIERLKDEYLKHSKNKFCAEWSCGTLDNILSFLDVIEVKEVDLETNIQDYINSHFTEGCDGSMISDWYKVLGGIHYNDLKEIAKHFFELGLKVQKGE